MSRPIHFLSDVRRAQDRDVPAEVLERCYGELTRKLDRPSKARSPRRARLVLGLGLAASAAGILPWLTTRPDDVASHSTITNRDVDTSLDIHSPSLSRNQTAPSLSLLGDAYLRADREVEITQGQARLEVRGFAEIRTAHTRLVANPDRRPSSRAVLSVIVDEQSTRVFVHAGRVAVHADEGPDAIVVSAGDIWASDEHLRKQRAAHISRPRPRAETASNLYRQAESALGQGKLDRADRLLHELRRRFPEHRLADFALYDQARLALRRGDHERALARVRALLAEEPEEALARAARQLECRLVPENRCYQEPTR